MRCHAWIGALFVALIAVGVGQGAAPCGCEPPEDCFPKRIAPVGGWFPYSGGLLGWWDPKCFPCGGAPDDYCRKSLPCVCRPTYPAFYIWGPPEVVAAPACGRR